MTLQNKGLLIFCQLMRHPFIKHFTFPICFKCQMTIKRSMLGSWATSCADVRGSASVIVLLSTSDHRPLCSSSSRLSFISSDVLSHHALYVCGQFLGRMHHWWCKLSLLLYDPFWTQIRKSLKSAFCLTSFHSLKHIENKQPVLSLAKKYKMINVH